VFREGGRWGVDNRLIYNQPDPRIEFYDAERAGEYPFREFGEQISWRFARTLADHELGIGLNLDDATPSWTIDGLAMREVIGLAKGICVRKGDVE